MKPGPCPRLFEAEAVRDGRIDGAERASFERHARSCAACARAVGEYDALVEALRGGPARVDELHVRRERTRLLATFARQHVAARSGRALRPRLVHLAATAVLAVGVALIARPVPNPPDPFVPPRAAVRAEPTAAWSQRVEGDREVIALEHGQLAIHVEHSARAPHLVVLLPDGELEDIGTTFTVRVDDGRTQRVAVRDGSVVLRVRGFAPVQVGAGGDWTAPAPTPPPSALASAIGSAPSVPPPSSATVRVRERAPNPAASTVARDPSADFREAMAAMDRGEDREAAARFTRFVEAYPHDTRAEDAAYLRVITLERAGDEGAMDDAAADYLRRYPAGFRRAEVERLRRGAP